jgi:hypothetical protein
MSKHETAMTRAAWRHLGGALFEEYPLVQSSDDRGGRRVDGLIILGEPVRRLSAETPPEISGKDVVLLQSKASRLGMSVLGQALFSRELAMLLGPRSVRSVAVVLSNDSLLAPLAAKYGIEVFVAGKNRHRASGSGE